MEAVTYAYIISNQTSFSDGSEEGIRLPEHNITPEYIHSINKNNLALDNSCEHNLMRFPFSYCHKRIMSYKCKIAIHRNKKINADFYP